VPFTTVPAATHEDRIEAARSTRNNDHAKYSNSWYLRGRGVACDPIRSDPWEAACVHALAAGRACSSAPGLDRGHQQDEQQRPWLLHVPACIHEAPGDVRVPIRSWGGDGTRLPRAVLHTRPLSRSIVSRTGSRPPVGPAATTMTRTPTDYPVAHLRRQTARTLQPTHSSRVAGGTKAWFCWSPLQSHGEAVRQRLSLRASRPRCGPFPNEAQGRFRSGPIQCRDEVCWIADMSGIYGSPDSF
jgi:hypothetical protein